LISAMYVMHNNSLNVDFIIILMRIIGGTQVIETVSNISA
jgi:hypothetical protein